MQIIYLNSCQSRFSGAYLVLCLKLCNFSFRSRSDLVLDADHVLDFLSDLAFRACISFYSVLDKGGAECFCLVRLQMPSLSCFVVSDRHSFAIADFGLSDRYLIALGGSTQTLTIIGTFGCANLCSTSSTKDTRSRDQSFCNHDGDCNFDRGIWCTMPPPTNYASRQRWREKLYAKLVSEYDMGFILLQLHRVRVKCSQIKRSTMVHESITF